MLGIVPVPLTETKIAAFYVHLYVGARLPRIRNSAALPAVRRPPSRSSGQGTTHLSR